MKEIKVIRRSDLANGVAEKWREQYFRSSGWATTVLGSTEVAYEKIVAANGDPDKINSAIGNDSWTRYSCDSCGESFVLGVQMLEPDYETTPLFRADCILKAAEMLAKAKGGAA